MTALNLSLAGKVAMITGGRRGIGKAIALAFARAGADMIFCEFPSPEIEMPKKFAREMQKECQDTRPVSCRFYDRHRFCA